MIEQVIIHTDGACRGNPGPGGWGALLVYKGIIKELHGGAPETTNNRMELMAAIQALETLNKPCSVNLNTDSKYVLQGITEWMPNWKKRDWKTQIKLSIDPEKAKSYRMSSRPRLLDVCTMCGKYCSIKLSEDLSYGDIF